MSLQYKGLMDETKEPYIVQQSNEDALYTKMQRQTLDFVQRLSGKVWTDYNPHDPGVTLSEAANYALTELDYKLDFPLIDYLTEEDKPFVPERFGLYSYNEITETSVVTIDDYRRLFLLNIPEIANLQIDYNVASGGYSISFVKMPFCGNNESILHQIEDWYQNNRNLCEWLEKVEVAKADVLHFQAELEIESGRDATTIVAGIYWCILHYLSDDADTLSSENRKTEFELYRLLYKIKGVKCFRTCYFMKDGIPQSRFNNNSTLFIPNRNEELDKIVVYCGNTRVHVNLELFRELLKGCCLNHCAIRIAKVCNETSLRGVWHDIYSHYPISCDMPACYRLCSGDAKNVSSFEVYTRLYDWVITNGLEEVRMLPHLLSISKEDEDFPHTNRTIDLKSRYLDFLDKLYDVESQPAWLFEENCYGETPEGTLRRRMIFLRNVAKLLKDRAKARNVYMPETKDNCPMVKEWFCLLMGIDSDDGHTVSNVLPKHNLQLVERKNSLPDVIRRVDSLLISERMMSAENVQDVSFVRQTKDKAERKKEYMEIRSVLPFFNENIITGDLFRNGTNLKNYKIVKLVEDEYMLMFHNKEFGGWINLGHDTDKGNLDRLANILRRYLRELNRESETMYIVEPVLADTARAFELMIVLPSWTYRFHKPRFREECCRLFRSLIPAHLTGRVFWISEKKMRRFEFYYHQFMRTFTDDNLNESKTLLLKAIDELIVDAEEIQNLDDTN